MSFCDKINLIAYLEGEDPGNKIRNHLKKCPACRSELLVYRKLIQGMIKLQPSLVSSCSKKDLAIEAAIAKTDPDLEHLGECSICKDVYQTIKEALQGLEDRTEKSREPLPKIISELAADRKKKWLEARMKKVLDFQGIKDEKEQAARLKKLLEKEDDSLPKAAFPDDLADEDPEKDD